MSTNCAWPSAWLSWERGHSRPRDGTALGRGTGMSPLLGVLGRAAGLGFAGLDAVEAALAKRLAQSDDLAGGGVAIEAQALHGFPVTAAEVVGGLDGDVAIGRQDELEFAALAVGADEWRELFRSVAGVGAEEEFGVVVLPVGVAVRGGIAGEVVAVERLNPALHHLEGDGIGEACAERRHPVQAGGLDPVIQHGKVRLAGVNELVSAVAKVVVRFAADQLGEGERRLQAGVEQGLRHAGEMRPVAVDAVGLDVGFGTVLGGLGLVVHRGEGRVGVRIVDLAVEIAGAGQCLELVFLAPPVVDRPV